MNRFYRPLATARSSAHSRPPNLLRKALLAAGILALAGAHAADGDPDTSFDGDGVAYVAWSGGPADEAHLGVSVDGNVYVGATINRDNGNRDFAITRLAANGALDMGFGFQGYRTVGFDYVSEGYDSLRGVFPLSDGKLMLLGNAEVADEITAASPPAMVRLTAAGNVDTSFGVAGKLSIGVGQSPWPNGRLYLRGVARQPDGKFLFGGYCSNCAETYSAVVLRVDANGTPDASFGQGGWAKVSTPQPIALWSMAIDRQGRILLAGGTVEGSLRRPMIVCMTSTGLADASFGGGDSVALITLADGESVGWSATGITVDRDDALLLSVANYLPLDVARSGVIRTLANGSLHLNYAANGLRDLTRDSGSKIAAVAMRSDRRLVAAGWIDNAGHDFFAARMQVMGSMDNSFAGNGVARYPLSTNSDEGQALLLSAGKPVIAGCTYVTGVVGISILRLQSDLIFSDSMD